VRRFQSSFALTALVALAAAAGVFAGSKPALAQGNDSYSQNDQNGGDPRNGSDPRWDGGGDRSPGYGRQDTRHRHNRDQGGWGQGGSNRGNDRNGYGGSDRGQWGQGGGWNQDRGPQWRDRGGNGGRNGGRSHGRSGRDSRWKDSRGGGYGGGYGGGRCN
jgi:hypothetical protein